MAERTIYYDPLLGKVVVAQVSGAFGAPGRQSPVFIENKSDLNKLLVTTKEGKYLVCSAANGRYIGGGIPICPAANTGDGKLDAVLIRDVPGWRIPFYLPGLMMGRDLHFRIARHVLAEQITITGKNLRVNVDGEILSMDRADFRVLPRALQLICP